MDAGERGETKSEALKGKLLPAQFSLRGADEVRGGQQFRGRK